MVKHFFASMSVAAFLYPVALAAPSLAQTKSASACNDEYKADKAAIKSAKELKRDFIAACRASAPGTPTRIGGSAAPTSGPGAMPTTTRPSRAAAASGLKTTGACDDEYKANKSALKGAREKKKDFIAACRALPPGTPTPIGAAAGSSSAPSPAPAPAPAAAPPSPAPGTNSAPPPASTPRPQATSSQPAAPGESACASGYAHLPASHTAVQFCTDQEAKSRCPGQPVVWVNTKSRVYHQAGSNTYGHTKEGAYMCGSDATAEGDRASKNGH